MSKQFFKNRRAKYGGVSVLLAALLLVCVLLANTLLGTLAARYGWYVDLHATQTFSVGEKSGALVKAALDAAGEGATVQIHFCMMIQSCFYKCAVNFGHIVAEMSMHLAKFLLCS